MNDTSTICLSSRALYPIDYGFVSWGVLGFCQVPQELVKMAEDFQAKVASGQARKASSGFSGKGFTFDDSEQSESQQVKCHLKQYSPLRAVVYP